MNALVANNFVVRFDIPGKRVSTLPYFGGDVFLHPGTGDQLRHPEGHVTVYHRSLTYWNQWYEDEQANIGSPAVSWQTMFLYELRENGP